MDGGEIRTASHAKMFKMMLTKCLPQESLDSNRVTLLYFALVGLAACGELAGMEPEEKKRVVEWVYAQQLPLELGGGFRCAPAAGSGVAAEGHVTMTQCALLSLLLCGDNLSRVDREAVRAHLKSLQLPSGCFRTLVYGEADVRMVYSACVCAAVLDIFDSFDVERTIEYLLACQGYDGGFGGSPGDESHGGNTFCAVASLFLLKALDRADVVKLVKWLVSRLTSTGFNGRPNKDPDSCYTYWVGGALVIATAPGPVPLDLAGLRDFVCSCQAPTVGIAKAPGVTPDPLHTALPLIGLCNLHLLEGSMEPFSVELGCLQSLIPT